MSAFHCGVMHLIEWVILAAYMGTRNEQRRQSLRSFKLTTHCYSQWMRGQPLAILPAGWHLAVKVHWHQWVTITGYDNLPGASSCLISAVGAGTSCQSTVCDCCPTPVTVPLAISALDIGAVADINNSPEVVMDEGVEGFAPRPCQPPSLHHRVAVGIRAPSAPRVHMLLLEPSVVLAIAGLYQL